MSKKIFFIGDVALDEYYKANYFPKLKEKIIVHAMPSQMGGSIANAACVFKSLGNNPYFLTALNTGAITQQLVKNLNECGINTDYMVYDDTIPDAKCIIILAENEHTVFIPTLAIEKIEIGDETMAALMECDYIYSNFCEIAPICHNGQNALQVMTTLKQNGTKIWCDLDCADLSDVEIQLFDFLDVALLNEKGESNLTEKFGNEWKSVLFSKGVNLIVVTQAENGCTLYPKASDPIQVDGVPVDVVDVTGAGDTFGSSFMHAYQKSEDLKLCAKFANYVSARAVTGVGARYGVTSKQELCHFIDSHGGCATEFDVFLKGN